MPHGSCINHVLCEQEGFFAYQDWIINGRVYKLNFYKCVAEGCRRWTLGDSAGEIMCRFPEINLCRDADLFETLCDEFYPHAKQGTILYSTIDSVSCRLRPAFDGGHYKTRWVSVGEAISRIGPAYKCPKCGKTGHDGSCYWHKFNHHDRADTRARLCRFVCVAWKITR